MEASYGTILFHARNCKEQHTVLKPGNIVDRFSLGQTAIPVDMKTINDIAVIEKLKFEILDVKFRQLPSNEEIL